MKTTDRNLNVGDTAQMQRVVLEEDVMKFAELSGDFNPVHLDESYAKTTRFGKRIAHGLFCAAMISALLGTELPGLGTIIISENMHFKHPVYLGDVVTAKVQIISVDKERNRVTVSFCCTNQLEKVLLEGCAEVMI